MCGVLASSWKPPPSTISVPVLHNRSKPGLLPVFPMSREYYVGAQASVGNRMHQNAIAQAARTNHPPVIRDPRDQSDIPIRAMLGSEKRGRDPESASLISAQRDLFELRRNQPAHQPRAPE